MAISEGRKYLSSGDFLIIRRTITASPGGQDGASASAGTDGTGGGGPATGSARAGTPTRRVDVNRASAAELEALPGIGPALAQRIVADREVNGPFRRPQDLRRVAGIGEKTVAKLLPYITTGP